MTKMVSAAQALRRMREERDRLDKEIAKQEALATQEHNDHLDALHDALETAIREAGWKSASEVGEEGAQDVRVGHPGILIRFHYWYAQHSEGPAWPQPEVAVSVFHESSQRMAVFHGIPPLDALMALIRTWQMGKPLLPSAQTDKPNGK